MKKQIALNRKLIKAIDNDATADVVEKLLQHGANPNAKGSEHDYSALHHAALRNNVETCKRLLAAGAKVDIKNQGKSTPLHSAAMNDHDEVVKLLLLAGSNPNATNVVGNSPLHLALMGCSQGLNASAIHLIEAGASIHHRGRYRVDSPLNTLKQAINRRHKKKLIFDFSSLAAYNAYLEDYNKPKSVKTPIHQMIVLAEKAKDSTVIDNARRAHKTAQQTLLLLNYVKRKEHNLLKTNPIEVVEIIARQLKPEDYAVWTEVKESKELDKKKPKSSKI